MSAGNDPQELDAALGEMPEEERPTEQEMWKYPRNHGWWRSVDGWRLPTPPWELLDHRPLRTGKEG